MYINIQLSKLKTVFKSPKSKLWVIVTKSKQKQFGFFQQ